MTLKRRAFLQIATTAAATQALPDMTFAADTNIEPGGQFTLWQLPPQTPTQNMNYVLQSGSGKVIVIDGGMTGDAAYLRGFLGALGNHVHAWFISHAHRDHFGAATAILNKLGKLKIDSFHASLSDENWIKKHEPESLDGTKAFNKAIKDSGHHVLDLSLGQVLQLDEIRIKILAIKNPEITANAINNSSVVMRVSTPDISILFTGDLGVEGGRKLMKTSPAGALRADYVQMAHHGQNGVDEDFYRAVGARYCLWPTPRWLWDNDNGKGQGSGPWQTLVVRGWMDKLDIKKHYVSADGLYRIVPLD